VSHDPAASQDITVVILCGGQGTRIREASESLPKPLIDIGGKPVLWHVMKTYGHYGFRRFVLALGYKGWEIKRYFLNYREHVSDFALRLSGHHEASVLNDLADEDWDITFAETGLMTGTGGRIRRAREYLTGETFMLTYGDGIGAVDIPGLLAFHRAHGRLGTVTGVHPSSRYGEMHVDEATRLVTEFNEKPTLATGWVSGGFFVFQREFIDSYLDDDPNLLLEHRPLQQLARDGQLAVFAHEGFWMGMDTYRDYMQLNSMWDAGDPPWKVWPDRRTAELDPNQIPKY
jgi:glucose-1-phosphate cytidylyltransferase